MKKWIAWLTIWIFLLAAILCGCARTGEKGGLGSEVWVETAPLTWGDLESDKLAVLPWNSGRLEETSRHTMVESENGYYYVKSNTVFYADKAQMDNWVLLCNDPKCDHLDQLGCAASLAKGWIAAKDGRLYAAEASGTSTHLYYNLGAGFYIVSVAPDASDKRFAFAPEDEMFTLNEGRMSQFIMDETWFYYMEDMDEAGNSQKILVAASEDGSWTFRAPADAPSSYLNHQVVRGDPWFYWYTWSEDRLLRLQDGKLVEGADIDWIPNSGGYISGNILRVFEANNGYYDIDTQTGEKVKIASARLKNSNSEILSPNCIIESTLLGSAQENRTEYKMEVFDGECWRTVELPKEWQAVPKESFLSVLGISSDAILLIGREHWSQRNVSLYRIPIDSETLRMEYFATIEMPVREEEETA